METALITLHYFICLFLIIVILLQAGKGADMGAAFGGASQTVFGGRGSATFLSKLTAVVAISFLVTSIWLAQLAKRSPTHSVIDTSPAAEVTTPAEATPPVEAAPAPAEKPAETK